MIGLLLDRSQIGDDGIGVVGIEVEFRHVGMRRRQPPAQLPREPIEIEALADNTERRRRPMGARIEPIDGVTARAVFLEQGAAAGGRLLGAGFYHPRKKRGGGKGGENVSFPTHGDDTFSRKPGRRLDLCQAAAWRFSDAFS